MSDKNQNIGASSGSSALSSDVEFDEGHMPAIYNALSVDAETPIGKVKTILEVRAAPSRRHCAYCRNVFDRRSAAWHRGR